MMNILSCTGDSALARVTVASFGGDDSTPIEFVSARDPNLPLSEKCVIIVSTQFGCPIGCPMCDSGTDFKGNLTSDQMLEQIDCALDQHGKDSAISSKKLKLQFARMGEPALNPHVLEVLRVLPKRYGARGLIPCIATTMPSGSDAWFEKLFEVKETLYADHLFQLQVSINSTDSAARDRLMPHPKWSFEDIAAYGKRFVKPGDRKMSLNFAWSHDAAIDPSVVARHFDPNHFCIKITPLNPTIAAAENDIASAFAPDEPDPAITLCNEFSRCGFETILSIGDTMENEIGSNCGMSVRRFNEDRSI